MRRRNGNDSPTSGSDNPVRKDQRQSTAVARGSSVQNSTGKCVEGEGLRAIAEALNAAGAAAGEEYEKKGTGEGALI